MSDQGKNKPRGPKRDERGSRPSTAQAEAAGERIAKRLARAGVASRREAETLIAAGRVKVNGKVLDSPAVNVMPGDRIDLDNQPIPAIERTRLFLFHKPAGVVTTNRDPEGRRTVFDALPDGLPRLMTIGRLDINTEGLLLLTNDGGLARVLELPQTGWLRRYRVRVHGKVDETALAGLRDGIAVDGVFYGAMEATLEREQGSNAWLSIGLREGKNREVKNVLGALGLEVTRLIRVSFGPFQLGELAEGAVHELKGRTLRDQLGERLIEESGANFEAPVVTQFSNKPEVKNWAPAAQPARGPKFETAGEGGLVKNRKRQREDHRESMLGKLSTRAPGPRGKPSRRDEKEKPYEPPRARSANVWMAPGARPVQPRKTNEGDDPVGRTPPDRSKPRAADPNQNMRRGRARSGEADATRPDRGHLRDDRPPRGARPDRAQGGHFAGEQGERAPRPKRDWVKNPPRPGKAERAAAKVQSEETGSRPARAADHRKGAETPRKRYEGERDGQSRGTSRNDRGSGPREGEKRPRSSAKPAGERFGKSFGKAPGKPGGFKPSGPRAGREGGSRGDEGAGPRREGGRPAGKGKPGADRRR